ncbi:MAG: hypothetical protein FWH14_01815 [Oscillospiraceae bacterium]|nr:hypothetical protein [Oscillospiraceae bacterium]
MQNAEKHPHKRVFFSWLPQILCIFLALPLGELSAATPTERAFAGVFPLSCLSCFSWFRFLILNSAFCIA